MSIKLWITLLINLLIILIVSSLSFFFYFQFQDTLDQRVLLQLDSIKRLKQIQIEKYLQAEWQDFLNSINTLPWETIVPSLYISDSLKSELNQSDINCISNKLNLEVVKDGIYDLSSCSNDDITRIGFVHVTDDQEFLLKVIGIEKIQEILLERTGMGESGETYLVAKDLQLRSLSRFFPKDLPISITADTKGVQQALAGQDSIGIFEDYRNIPVYSAYQKLNVDHLNWVILSEIDVAEVSIPLQELRKKLWMIVLIMIVLAFLLSSLVAGILAAPLLKMQDLLTRMSLGIYDMKINVTQPNTKEFRAMFDALKDLKHSIHQSIQFSSEIGQMNLDAKYIPASEKDILGKSLIQMQEKLLTYRNAAKQNSILAKQSLIRGQENERRRLSRELHDGLGPVLTTLKISLQTTSLSKEEKIRLTAIVDRTINEIRRISYDLMPAALLDFGAGKALRNFVNLIRKSTNINIIYDEVSEKAEGRFGLDVDICIYRVCQELIHNSIKHADADKITISLTSFSNRVSLFFTDDGIGFDPKAISTGSGLKNIRERIEALNGFLQISSDTNGTVVEVEIPLPNG